MGGARRETEPEMEETSNATDTADSGDHLPLLDEILGMVPRLIDRTSSQIQFSQTLLSMLPCARRLVSTPRIDDGEVPSHEATQPTDVLSLLADEDTDAAADDVEDPLAPTPAASAPTKTSSFDDDGDPPEADALAIPDYDSLAASQVVPRLTTLEEAELRAIGSYEAANRARRTILNRVNSLLAD